MSTRTSAVTATLRYMGINQAVQVKEPGKTILEISRENKIPHLHECGGHGKCTTCRVRIIEGSHHLSPPTPLEKSLAQARRWEPGVRLGCQCKVYGDAEIERLLWTSADVHQIQKEIFPEGHAEERAIAILFCDLRDFTKISAVQFPFDMAYMLDRFYTLMGDSILMNNGIIYQYVGDEIVGIFGTTGGGMERSCMDATRAALAMSSALDRLNREELSGLGTHFQAGIGIHFGKAFIGHLGHPRFRQFSVIGDPVNVASRIQAYTRPTNTHILVSQTVANALPRDKLLFGQSFEPSLKGIEEMVQLTEIKGFKEPDVAMELQASLKDLLEDQDHFASVFYTHLFQLDDQLRALFKGDIQGQGRLMTHMLSGIVFGLSRPEFLQSGLETLGRNHARYGVHSSHYPLAHQAFMKTIRDVAGSHCTPKMEHAWDAALAMVIEGMRKGAMEVEN